MTDQALISADSQLGLTLSDGRSPVPALIQRAGRKTSKRFLEFLTAEIRNPRTRKAYYSAIDRFLAWCELQQFDVMQLEPMHVAMYIEGCCPEVRPEKLTPLPDEHGRKPPAAKPKLEDASIKQHLAAIRRMFDYLITGGLLEINPAAAVRGPKIVVDTGKTPIFGEDELRMLLESIELEDKNGQPKIGGLRDRALIYLMFNSFARIGAVVSMNVEDVFKRGQRYRIRLHEKGGKYLENWISFKSSEYLVAYMDAAKLKQRGTPLFRTLNRKRQLTETRLQDREVLGMIKRRAKKAGLNPETCCHSLRATGITEYMKNGGTLEAAQRRAGHASSRTTNLYNRARDDEDEFECEKVGL